MRHEPRTDAVEVYRCGSAATAASAASPEPPPPPDGGPDGKVYGSGCSAQMILPFGV